MNKFVYFKSIRRTIGCLILIFMFALTAQAADRYWVGGDGDWDDAANWSATAGGAGGAGVPTTGDDAYATQSDSTNRVINYQSAVDPSIHRLSIDSTGTGIISFSQSQDTFTSELDNIGIDGTGTYNQSGGTHTISVQSILGMNTTSNGTYNLSGGSLFATSGSFGEYIGWEGRGTFNHTGGDNTIAFNFLLGVQGTGKGTYNLSGASSAVTGNKAYFGIFGRGEFNQTEGTHTSNELYLGFYGGSRGTYNLDGGDLNVNQNEYVGVAGQGTFNQTGGTHTVTNSLFLGFADVNGPSSGSVGMYSLTGGNIAIVNDLQVGTDGIGTFNQSGGAITVSDEAVIGTLAGSTGTYNLFTSGTLSADSMDVGESGTGNLNQNGGTITVTNTLNIGSNAGSTGTYNLSNSGDLSAGSMNIGESGTGTFSQSGGTTTVTSTVTVAKNAGSVGTYNLTGGTLNATELVNNGTFNYSGGSFNANLINNGVTTIGGGGTRILNGDVTNNKIIKTNNTTPFYSGTFTNNGSVIGDPKYGGDVINNASGFLVGAVGEEFLFGRDFFNYSQQNTEWNTAQSFMGFQDSFDLGGTIFTTQLDHELYHPGEDFGADMLGFTDNFAWEALSLAGGNTLDIFDGDTVTTGAGLYIERFLLGDGLSQLSSITSNINIYYLASLLDNAYLGGLDYVLSGGGSLIAIGTAAVPEPSTLLLLGIVLLGFVSVKGAGKLFRTI